MSTSAYLVKFLRWNKWYKTSNCCTLYNYSLYFGRFSNTKCPCMRIMWRSMQLLNYCFSNKRTVSQDFRTGNITYSMYLGYLDCIFMFNNSEQNLHQFIGTSEWDAFPFLNLNWLLIGNANLTKFSFYVRIWFPEFSDFGESTKLLGSTYRVAAINPELFSSYF